MAGYQTIEALRPILHRGPPAMPVVDRALVGRKPFREHWCSGSDFIKVGYHLVLAPHVVAEIVARREKGESYGIIAQAMGVAKATVVRYCRHVATPLKRRMTCWESGLRVAPERNRAFAERLRRAGFSYSEIGTNLKCSETAARRLLRDTIRTDNKPGPTLRMVPRVAAITGVACAALRRDQFEAGGKSTIERSKARHILFWLLRVHTGKSYVEIGGNLGGFDHSTIRHGYLRADAVARRIGVSSDIRPQTAARLLWAADWSEARPC